MEGENPNRRGNCRCCVYHILLAPDVLLLRMIVVGFSGAMHCIARMKWACLLRSVSMQCCNGSV